ncbi:hypothetical protein [Spiroplasma endosymbiont of Aspidapion aeneum]|uniref:hypothetical protein n=1 Tax=Spiroplasma endosymbiont of Aspidapion aeneum TaxID=3066276 RepID=UPI00313B9041
MDNVFMCGSVESSDVLVKYTKTESPLKIVIESKVIYQFGDEIKHLSAQYCKEIGLTKGELFLNDQGAIPAVLKARILGVVDKMKGDK